MKYQTKLSHEFEDFLKLMQQTTENLKKMSGAIEDMRWQFDNEEYEEFLKEMSRATDGWIHSHC